MTLYSDLDKAFNPKTIAIVGVSSYDKDTNVAYSGLKFLRNLKSAGFNGRIYPVNPKATNDIDGTKVYPSLLSVPEPLDLVIITVKAELVPKVLQECIVIKANDVHICTSGFGETGEADGKILQVRLREIAQSGGLRVCGPNSIGYHVPSARMKMYDGPFKEGTVAFATQSGGCGQSFIVECAARGIGVSKVISFGNALTLGATDYLQYLAEDPQTRVICLYLEGVNDGRKFTELVKQVNLIKPVIIWKGGATATGARAVSTHTGSLAGDIRVWDAFFRQTKAIKVASVEEMADVAMNFIRLKPFTGRRAAVFGSGGGGSNVARGDICTEEGIELPLLSLDTRKQLMEFITLVNQSVMNPLDIPFLVHDNSLLKETFNVLAADPIIDMLILNVDLKSLARIEKSSHDFEEFKQAICRFNLENRSHKPLMVALMDQWRMEKFDYYATKLRQANITVYYTVRDACRSLRRFVDYNEYVARST